ncbi:MAG: hypothetical protein M3040_04480 [Bacteroidota bacterium]|nr:hypothetical protein [Bacteroidota bacterium]
MNNPIGPYNSPTANPSYLKAEVRALCFNWFTKRLFFQFLKTIFSMKINFLRVSFSWSCIVIVSIACMFQLYTWGADSATVAF